MRIAVMFEFRSFKSFAFY